MAAGTINVVLAHGAWADGSSWARVITALNADGVRVTAPPLPLTSLADDVAALDRSLDRTEGPIVLAGHAYAGAVIAEARSARVKALVYVAALAPDAGETVADVFYRAKPHPKAPKLAPDANGLIWLPDDAFKSAFAQNASAEDRGSRRARSRAAADFAGLHHGSRRPSALEEHSGLVPHCRRRPDDRARDPAHHGRAHEGDGALAHGRSCAHRHRAGCCR
jgi:predicted alpha/beta hydrolase family esterase